MLDKKYQRTAFLNCCQLYIFEICVLLQVIISKINSNLSCFLHGFGIAVPIFSN